MERINAVSKAMAFARSRGPWAFVACLAICLATTATADAKRMDAVAYSDSYADSPNSCFHYFTDEDCTNFASQCLWAGGIDMVFGLSNNWWIAGSASTDSWTLTDSLLANLVARGKAINMGKEDLAKVVSNTFRNRALYGDVLMYAWPAPDHNTAGVVWDHSAIEACYYCYHLDNSSSPRYGDVVNYHSVDRKHAIWSMNHAYRNPNQRPAAIWIKISYPTDNYSRTCP